ncbi:MAG: UxaA family hydrolase [Janthinobacterium lividum]
MVSSSSFDRIDPPFRDRPEHPPSPTHFNGIRRADGRVATRNYIGVFVAGNCAATAARRVANWFTPARLQAFPNVDGVVPFVHEIGCGMEMTGEPMDLLRRTLSGTIRHPNIGAAVVLALGCERNNIYGFMEQEQLVTGPLLQTLVLQELGGTQAAIDAGIAAVRRMLPVVDQVRREPCPLSRLVIGLQASNPLAVGAMPGRLDAPKTSVSSATGSTGAAATASRADSADTALGAAVDLLVARGGTAILSATSAVATVADAFLARSATPAVRDALARRLAWWRDYTLGRNTRFSGIPPGFDVPAVIAQSGSTPLVEVVEYAKPVTAHGLVFMDAPSYEAVSVSGQIASGAHLVCLTTRQGSSFGSFPAPTLKIATDTALFRRMEEDLDVNAGALADGTLDVAGMAARLLDAIVRHASGEPTKAEELGVGDNEFVPWPIGALA